MWEEHVYVCVNHINTHYCQARPQMKHSFLINQWDSIVSCKGPLTSACPLVIFIYLPLFLLSLSIPSSLNAAYKQLLSGLMIWSPEVLHWVRLHSPNGHNIAAISQLLAKCLIFTAHLQLPLTKCWSLFQDIIVANHHCTIRKLSWGQIVHSEVSTVGSFLKGMFLSLLQTSVVLNISKSFLTSFFLQQRRCVKYLPAA